MRKGGNYTDTGNTIHIGFLDFSLFPDDREFYATNYLMNARTHEIYTDKLRLSVVNLNHIDQATEEDKAYEIDRWARLFKARTWEEFRMIAEKDQTMMEAGNALYQMSIDEVYQEQLERSRINEMFNKAAMDRMKNKADEAERAAQEAKNEAREAKNEAQEAKSEARVAKQERDKEKKLRQATEEQLKAALDLLEKHGIDPTETTKNSK